ncbi:hypothetical protein [Rugamonas aquatica]|uniref:Uncharacterized protein n=1 Tax=Rugamonas aquatica TaxID=2743357 RepID=A0A6A7N743_9BURK|nr:hypothetical protein [Rugamonas aquatica]MQA40761.1 hypothetical protein [Rugamonas aquatica]
MFNKAKLGNWSAVLVALYALTIFGIWSLAEYVNVNLAGLPIKRMASKQDVQTALDVKKLFPVWVASSERGGEVTAEGSVEQLFKAAPAVAESPAPTAQPDYAALLASRLVLDSITASGAFINGKFYRVGEGVTDFEYPLHGKQIIPVLERLGPKSVFIVHGARRIELSL